MSVQRVAAAACAVAGVVVLAGFGWALLAAAFLLFISPTPKHVAALVGKLAEVGRWAARSQARVAVVAMPPAVAVLTVGAGLVSGFFFGVVVGIAAAMITLGVAVGALSLLVGWDQAVE